MEEMLQGSLPKKVVFLRFNRTYLDTLEPYFIKHFGHEPTEGQRKFFLALDRMLNSSMPRCTLLLTGYAGTGKTTSTKAVIDTFRELKQRAVLLAPTGRAAKILGSYSGQQAFTIHKYIYQRKAMADGSAAFSMAVNKHKNTLFIVDEASMIGESGVAAGGFQYRSLLDDLIEFVFSGDSCRLLLIGDNAQLPPVGIDQSPALQLKKLQADFYLTIAQIEFNEVLRQAQDSGILYNATLLRVQQMENPEAFPVFDLGAYTDIIRIGGADLQEYLDDEISSNSIEDVVVITRSNKRANLFNEQIRRRVLWQEEEINAGDHLMIVRNNYFWLDEDEQQIAGFIANGDTAEVLKIIRTEDMWGFRFADVSIELVDYDNIPAFEVKVILDTLHSDGPSLDPDKAKALYHYVAETYLHLGDKRLIHRAVMKDPYYNALQVKFAYAVTCHKAQGGQWPVVFVEQGYLTDDMMDLSFQRWLYTAFTRAQQKLYLVNFHASFFGEEEDLF